MIGGWELAYLAVGVALTITGMRALPIDRPVLSFFAAMISILTWPMVAVFGAWRAASGRSRR
jgi:hypothetical protein